MNLNLRYFDNEHVGISLDETTTRDDIKDLLWVFACPKSLAQVSLAMLLYVSVWTVRGNSVYA